MLKKVFVWLGDYAILTLGGVSLYVVLLILAGFIFRNQSFYEVYLLLLNVVLPVLVLVGVYFYAKARKYQTSVMIVSLASSLIIGFIFFVVTTTYTDFPPTHEDYLRIANIRQLQLALELYADANQSKYPPLPGEQCLNISSLESYMVPSPLSAISHDRESQKGHDDYMIAVSGDRLSYVLRAVFNDNSTALKDDLDGVVLGCNCDDPAYCVSARIK